MKKLAVLVVLLSAVLAFAVGCSSDSKADKGSDAPGEDLVGLFRLDGGVANGAEVTGSWFRMVQAGGTAEAGPYMVNADSPADGGKATLLQPGTAGGLRTGSYQSEPKPAFRDGDSLSGSIMQPTKFFAVRFGISTNPVDPQTGNAVVAPRVTNSGGKLTANLAAWAASWNNQEFNQGAPKAPAKGGPKVPGAAQAQEAWDWVSHKWFGQSDASSGNGPEATGTYDPATKRYTLNWTSYIVDGPFNGFTGVWHLEGTFESGQAAPSGSPGPSK